MNTRSELAGRLEEIKKAAAELPGPEAEVLARPRGRTGGDQPRRHHLQAKDNGGHAQRRLR